MKKPTPVIARVPYDSAAYSASDLCVDDLLVSAWRKSALGSAFLFLLKAFGSAALAAETAESAARMRQRASALSLSALALELGTVFIYELRLLFRVRGLEVG